MLGSTTYNRCDPFQFPCNVVTGCRPIFTILEMGIRETHPYRPVKVALGAKMRRLPLTIMRPLAEKRASPIKVFDVR